MADPTQPVIINGNQTIAADTDVEVSDSAITPVFTANDRPAYIFSDTSGTAVFTNRGTVHVSADADGSLIGIAVAPGSTTTSDQFLNGTNGKFYVAAQQYDGTAYGYESGTTGINFFNGGTFEVDADQGTAYGVKTSDSTHSIVNTGQFNINGTSAFGADIGLGSAFTNSGTVSVYGSSQAIGVEFDQYSGSSFSNTGTITATGPSGAADANTIAVLVAHTDGGTSTFNNSGTLQGGYAFWVTSADASAERLYNSGTIHGMVDLGAGNDIFTNAGLMSGDAMLGAGDDMYNAIDGNINGSGELDGTVYGGDGNDSLSGGRNSDVLDGGNGNDTLSGDIYNDILYGGTGNDNFYGGTGSDTYYGGDGIDTVYYGDSNTGVQINLTTGIGNKPSGTDHLTGIEVVVGSIYDDTLTGSSGDDTLYGGPNYGPGTGNNTFYGETGNDTYYGGDGFDTVSYADSSGGVTINLVTGIGTKPSGTDHLTGIEAIIGSDYNDTLTGSSTGGQLYGGAGDDTIYGGGGGDTLYGGTGSDTYYGGGGIDTVSYADSTGPVTINLTTGIGTKPGGTDHLSGIETVIGSNYSDTLTGSSSNDTFYGGADDDTLYGGTGNDTFYGGTGSDTYYGGDGIDTVSYIDSSGPVTINLAIGISTKPSGLDSLNGIEIVVGSAFGDTLIGTSGNDTFDGGGGNDIFYGSAGNDTYYGGDAGDTVSYASSTGPVTVSLVTGIGTKPVGTDHLNGIESLIGSNYNDTLTAGSGSGTISGGAGDDILYAGAASGGHLYYGGDGIDTLSFAGATGAVTVNLTTGATTVPHGGDILSGIEIVIGSNYNDTLTGSSGNDTFYGGTGSDTYYGGAGIDTVSYANATGAVTINLTTGIGTKPGGTDHLTGIETIVGSNYNDTLTGSSGNDIFYGGAGNDTVSGGGGIDTLVLSGGYRAYTLSMHNGAGTVSGGTDGTDTLSSVETLSFVDGVYTTDPNSHAAEVMRLYDILLHRAPDGAGLDYWVDQLDHGTSYATIANGFLTSAEFQTENGTLSDSAYIDFLYQSSGRAPDANGKAALMDQLAHGTARADLVSGFSDSSEHIAATAAELANGLFVTSLEAKEVAGLYDASLGHEPDAAGLAHWDQELTSGAMTLSQVADSFAASTQFTNALAGKSNADIVDYMYESVLHRQADPGGLTYWTNLLDHGMTDGQLLLGFSDSIEHYGLIQSHITGGIETV